MIKNKKVAYFYTSLGGASRAAKRGQKAIELNNEYLGSISIINKDKDLDQNKKQIISWAKDIIKNKIKK